MMPGTTIAGRNSSPTVTPAIVNSQLGQSRSKPSSHPAYQSGWDGDGPVYGT